MTCCTFDSSVINLTYSEQQVFSHTCTKLFGDQYQLVLLGNKKVYMVDPAKNMFQSISFLAHKASQGVLTKDPTLWLDVAKPH